MTPLQFALVYARRGWPVFPCNPKTKRPLVKGAEAGAGGVKLATTDAAQIEAWWKKWPKAMVGLATGAAAGVFVIDIDAGTDEKTGEVYEARDLLRRLEAELGDALPETWRVKTPRGGWHLYFRHPGEPVGNRAGLLGKGSRIDVRGDGGYVILPPSQRPDGETYVWQAKPAGADSLAGAAPLPPAALLDCVLRRGKWADSGVSETASQLEGRPGIAARAVAGIAPAGETRTGGLPNGTNFADVDAELRKYALSALDGECEAVACAGRGERNNRLNIAALKVGGLVGAGVLGQAVAAAALEDAAARAGLVADDGRRAVLATIESGMNAGLKHPRDLSDVRAQAAQRLARRARGNDPRRVSGDRSSSSAGGDDGGAAPPAFFDGAPPADEGAYGRILPKGDGSDAGDDDGAASGAGGSANSGSGGNGGRRGRSRGHDEPAEDDDGLDLQLAFYPMTDLGNAERFAARNRDRFKYCPALGWLYYDGARWNRTCAEEHMIEAVHETVRGIQREADALVKSSQDKVVGTKYKNTKNEEDVWFSELLAAWGRSSESGGHMSAIPNNARAYLAIDETELDKDPFKINVQNGTLVLRKGVRDGDAVMLKPHDPGDLITKIAPVDYDPAAQCPIYDAFLAEVQPQIAMRRFLHQWGGLSLTGDVTEQKFAFFYGKGRNGKSTLIEAWGHVAGDFGRAVPVETFVNDRPRSGSGPSPDLAMLRSVRFAHTTEPEKGVRLSEGLVKLVTGGDQVPARELNMPFFMLRPTFKLTMSGNYKPHIDGGEATHGIWRRVVFVPWKVVVDENKIDRKLPEKLRGEASGILNRLIDGLRDWADGGLIQPDDVIEATEAYRRESDPLGRFLEACIVADPGHREQSSKLYEVFQAWARASGEREWSARGFAQAMSERGYHIKHSNVNWWLDVRLTKTINDFVDMDGKPIKNVDASGDGSAGGDYRDDTVPL